MRVLHTLRGHYHFGKSRDQLFSHDNLLSLKITEMQESVFWQFIFAAQTAYEHVRTGGYVCPLNYADLVTTVKYTIQNILIIKPTRCTNFSNLFLE